MRKFIDAATGTTPVIEEDFHAIGKKAAAAAAAGALVLGSPPASGEQNPNVGMDSVSTEIEPASAPDTPMDSVSGFEPASAPKIKESKMSFLASLAEHQREKTASLKTIDGAYRAFMSEADQSLDEGIKEIGMALAFAGLALGAGAKAAQSMTSHPAPVVQQADSDAWPDFGEENRKAWDDSAPAEERTTTSVPAAVNVLVKQAEKSSQLSFHTRQEWAYLTMTLWGEARGGGIEGMTDVGSVIRNRLQLGRWGDTYRDVVTADKQFSCWKTTDPNLKKMYEMFDIDTKIVKAYGTPEYDVLIAKYGNDPSFKMWIEAKKIAWGILSNNIQDTTNGADHYYANRIHMNWSDNMTVTKEAGSHIFFKS